MTLPQLPRRPSLADDVLDQLRHQITSGVWPVGSRIPTETELVTQLGIARNTIREAIRALAHTGLLEIRQGSGTYVTATSELVSVMHRRFAATKPTHINEFRALLESSAAALAASRRTKTDLRRLDAALARRERAWDSTDAGAFAEADADFHLAVVAAAHNDVLTAVYADLRDVIRGLIEADLGKRTATREHVDHARLVTAIRDQNTDTARAEADAHPHSWS
ncbi:MAG: FadR/GntR family transcriptional regulator [Jatrophihabitans sp.]